MSADQGRTPTEEEIVESARAMGADIDVGGVTGLGVAILQAFELVIAAGYEVPVRIVVDVGGLRFSDQHSPRATEGAYDTSSRTIFLNGQSDRFLRLGPGVRTRGAEHGHWGRRVVSGHPLAPLIHLIGHALHHHRAPEMYEHLMALGKQDQPWWVEELRDAENFVSETALDDWMSFVAEVFTAKVLGIEVSEVVMGHYRRVEGLE